MENKKNCSSKIMKTPFKLRALIIILVYIIAIFCILSIRTIRIFLASLLFENINFDIKIENWFFISTLIFIILTFLTFIILFIVELFYNKKEREKKNTSYFPENAQDSKKTIFGKGYIIITIFFVFVCGVLISLGIYYYFKYKVVGPELKELKVSDITNKNLKEGLSLRSRYFKLSGKLKTSYLCVYVVKGNRSRSTYYYVPIDDLEKETTPPYSVYIQTKSKKKLQENKFNFEGILYYHSLPSYVESELRKKYSSSLPKHIWVLDCDESKSKFIKLSIFYFFFGLFLFIIHFIFLENYIIVMVEFFLRKKE